MTLDLEARRMGIGGSDVAAILGLSPWATPLDIYLSKRGEAEPVEENERMYWGTRLEPVIRAEFMRRMQIPLAESVPMLVHPEHEFMLANVDGMTDERVACVFEAKATASPIGWGEDGSSEVPEHYQLQVQHYMAVTGAPLAYVAVLIAGWDFRVLFVDRDEELIAMLIDAEREFWQRVVDGNPPPPRTFSEASKAYRKAPENAVEATGDVAAHVLALAELRKEKAEIEAREDALKLLIVSAMGDDGDTLTHEGKTLATWKMSKGRTALDAKALRAEYPEIADQFTKTGEPSRRLLLK